MAKGNGKTRRRKQGDIEEAIDDSKAEERRKNSELSEDERRALLFQHVSKYELALAAKKKADADLKNTCKVAKAELGKDAVDDIKDVIALKSPEGEAELRAELERKLRVARYVNAPVGHQFTFSEDMRPSEDRAFEEGKRSGLEGAPARPPHDPSVPQHGKWMEGWHAGQSVLLSDFRSKLDTAPPTADLPTVDTSDRPFAPPPDDEPRVAQDDPLDGIPPELRRTA